MKKQKENLILALDTSAQAVSVALLNEKNVFGHAEQAMERGQGEALMPLMERVMADARKKPADLTGIAVAVGPGSFTGVRIGLSAARGLGLALGIPVWGVTNFEAAAFGAAVPVTVVLDTKRGDYYAQSFDKNGVAVGAPGVQTPQQLEKRLPLTVVGDGAARLNREIGCAVMEPKSPAAVSVGRIALGRLNHPLPPAPLYLRDADVTC